MVLQHYPKCLCLGSESLLVCTGTLGTGLLLTLCRGVGFLRYWSISNLPLFALAAPMLYIMVRSAFWTWSQHAIQQRKSDTINSIKELPASDRFAEGDLLRRLSLPQLVLALLALTTYHVQIITRLSSGYPVWYWWLACLFLDRKEIRIFSNVKLSARIICGWMIGYALIQGGLFASFLPPA